MWTLYVLTAHRESELRRAGRRMPPLSSPTGRYSAKAQPEPVANNETGAMVRRIPIMKLEQWCGEHKLKQEKKDVEKDKSENKG